MRRNFTYARAVKTTQVGHLTMHPAHTSYTVAAHIVLSSILRAFYALAEIPKHLRLLNSQPGCPDASSYRGNNLP